VTSRDDVTAVVVTYNGMPWIERCLESVEDYPAVVVDHGSTDGTLELVRERFPGATLVEQENLGLGAGFNRGMRAAPDARYYLLLNSDAWMLDGAVERMARFADAYPRAAVVGPRLLNPDGTLQRSVRGFPTLWRLSTEYLFLRKLAPRSRALNSFYAGGFDHDAVYEAEFLMAAVLLVRREATEDVGLFDESYFMFSEEVDWCYRFRQAGWSVVFFPEAEAVHVGGASWKKEFDPMFREQVRGHLRFLADHKGMKEAERARIMFLAGLRLRGWFFPRSRRATYRDAAEWLSSGSVESLLQSDR
jgi:GT2 family glycosyltransferase